MSFFGSVIDGRRRRLTSLGGGPSGLAGVTSELCLDVQQVTLGGANPTTVQFKEMIKVLGAQITLVQSATPGLDPADFTYVVDGTNPNQVDVYAWKYTSNANPTLVASTNNTAVINVMVVGLVRKGQSV